MLPFPVNPVLGEISVYQPGRPIEEVARELGMPESSVIKLASNENPLGPSPKAVAAMRHVLDNINLYPDGNAYYLKQKLSARLKVTPEHLLLGNGSNEIIEFVGHALLSPGTEVIVSQYCFAVYPLITKLFSAKLVSVPARNYGHDLAGMLGAITPQTRVIFVANPNNPTGTVVTPTELKQFIEKAPESVLVCLDEAYIEFVDGAADFLPLIRSGRKLNLLLMRTFSKIYGLAGLRVGYGIAHPELIGTLEKARQPFNLNSLGQAAAVAALDDREHVEKTCRNNAAGLRFFSEAFRGLELEFIPSSANFILVRVGDGQGIFERLQMQGIIVRPMAGYQLAEWIRITIGRPEENQRCLAALSALVGAGKP